MVLTPFQITESRLPEADFLFFRHIWLRMGRDFCVAAQKSVILDGRSDLLDSESSVNVVNLLYVQNTLHGHSKNVKCVRFLGDDGLLLASGSRYVTFPVFGTCDVIFAQADLRVCGRVCVRGCFLFFENVVLERFEDGAQMECANSIDGQNTLWWWQVKSHVRHSQILKQI